MIKISSGILRITSVAIILIAAVSILPADILGGNLTLEYSTYLGGDEQDDARGIAAGTDETVYVTGFTLSADFPVQNAYQAVYQTNCDSFVTRLSSSGSALLYSTYLGGAEDDYALGAVVDTDGSAYIVGYTGSTDLPTVSPYQVANAGNYDAFVTRLSSSGSALLYSTYLGGAGADYGRALAINTTGIIYITGDTASTNFPTENPYQSSNAGGSKDAFVTKFSSDGSALLYSTYLGSSDSGGWFGIDQGYSIAVDTTGYAYVAGRTHSGDFPTVNPYQAANGGGYSGFVTKFSTSGSTLEYSTYLSSEWDDFIYGLAIDTAGSAYVAGNTYGYQFPRKNAYQSTLTGGGDAFVTKFSASGSTLDYSTYLGGMDVDDIAYCITVDEEGLAYVGGVTDSSDFPVVNPYQASFAGSYDVFFTRFSASGSALEYSTYLGGDFRDEAYGIAIDTNGNTYLAGSTFSSNFPMENP